MPNALDFFGPEWSLRHDPFIKRLIEADDQITDYRYNYEFLGKTQAEGEAVAAEMERWLLDYEVSTLTRWSA